jgi:DNA-binding response OmpR family regulator
MTPATSPSPSLSPARILVAEDDADMRRLVIDSLRGEDYDFVDVSDGGQLLLRITDFYRLRPPPEPIDLIITDVRMPVCDGFEIIQGLRDADWRTPVILMTAFSDDQARARARTLGAVLLDKPFEMTVLRARVRELLRETGRVL